MAEVLEQQVDEQVQVDPPKSKKLWKALNDAKFYTKDYNSFSEQFSSPEKINALYTKLSESKFYTKSEEDFNNQFFAEPRAEPETKAAVEEPTTIINAPEDDDIASAESEADEADDLLEELRVVPKADEFHIVPDPDLPEPGIVEQDITSDLTGRITGERVRTEAELEAGRERVIKAEEERKAYNVIAKKQLELLPERPKDTFLRKGEGIEEKPEAQVGALGADFGVKLTQEEKVVEYTREALEKISEMSEDEAPNFFQGLGGQGEKLIPFIGTLSEIPELLIRRDVLNKPQDKRTESEQSMVDAIALLNSFEASGHKPTPYEWGEMVGMMIPFLGEFAATGGVATSVAKTIGKGLIKKGLEKGALNYTVRGTAGAIAQATANPQRYVEGTIKRMTPLDQAIINLETKEIDEIVRAKKGEKIGEAATKAYLTQVSEMLTERLGFAYGAGAKKFMKSSVAKHLVNEDNLAKYTLKQVAERKGITSMSELKKFTDRVGFQGVLTEVWGEELPNMALNEIITGDSGKTLLESLNPIDEDLLKMVVPTLILQGGMYAPSGIMGVAKKAKELVTKEKDVSKEKLVEPIEAKEEVIEKEVKPEDIAEAPVEEIKEEPKEEEDAISITPTEKIPVGKPSEVSEEVGEKVPIEKEKDIKPDVEKKVEEKPVTKKEELEKKIEKTETVKKSDYIKRRLKDVKDTPVFKKEVESLGDYTPHDKELANIESDKLIKQFQKEYDNKEGLNEAFKLLKNKEVPELMIGPLSAKINVKMIQEGMTKEALDVLDYKQKTLRESARTISGVTEESSPEETVSRLFAGLTQQKTEALGEELKEGKTYGQAFEDIKKRLGEVETAYKELKEKGTIKEGELPEITDKKVKSKRSKELKIRGKALRKEGFAQLDKYFKTQRGTLSMGMRVDSDLISGLAKVFRGYLLEFEGNTLAAFEKFKSDTSKKYDVTKEALDSFKKNILEQSEETINEFKAEKQQQIVENILRPEGKETNEERKARKETSKEIVEAYNEGKPDVEVLDLFSGIAGFEKITEQDTKEILDLMEKQSQLLSEGKRELAHNAWVDLMFKLGDTGLLKRAKTDVVQDIWYTWVLSGLTTIARSIKGSGVSDLMFVTTRLIANPKVAPYAIAQMIRGAKGNTKAYWHVLKTGQTEFNMTDFDPKLPQFTSEITNRPLEDLTNLKKIAKVLASPIIYAFRNIPAFDQVIGNIASEGNIAIAEFSRTDRGKKTAERLKDLKKVLAENRREEIRNLVDEELEDMKSSGETIPTGYKERRFREVRNEFRDRDAVKRALDDSRIGAFVSTPKGTLGFIYNAWINAVEVKKNDPNAVKAGKLMLKGVFPFIRVSFNWLNAGLEYTPAGLVRAGFKQSRWTKDGIEKMTDYEKRELIARSIIGMAVGTSILNSMFDWDEEEGFTVKDEEDMWIQVHGPLTGKWYETEGVNKGAKPWSFRFKLPDGEWSDYYLYRDNPIGHMLAPIGIMHDELRIAKFQKDLGKKESEITFDKMDMNYLLGAWVNGTFQYASDQSFNQGMKTLSGLFLKSERKTAGEKLGELITRPAEALVNPALYKQTYNYFKAYQGIPEKQDRSWLEHAYKGIPIVDGLIKNDAYDVFGYPIVRSFDVPGIPDFILETAKENLSYREELKEWQLLWKYEEVVLGGFLAPDKHKGYVLTSEDKDEFMKNAGEDMRERVNGNYERLNEMDAKELQIKLNSYKRKSKNKALKDINK